MAVPRSNYQRIFDSALEDYQRKTGKDLTKDPLLRTLETCHSPDAVLTILRGQIGGPGQSRNSSDKLTVWLIPTVKVISAFSETIGGAAALAYPPAGVIFTGIGVLLSAVNGAGDSRDKLFDLFTRIESIFKRLEIYVEVTLSAGTMDVIVKVVVEVLCVLAIMTKEIKQNRAKTFLKRLVGGKNLENALQTLERVTLEESRMTGAETLKAVHGIGDKVGDDIQGVQDVLQTVHDKVGGVEGMLRGVSNMLQGVVDDKVQGVDDRVKEIGDKVINSVENTGQQTESQVDIMAAEGLGGVSDRVADVDEARSAVTVKDIGFGAIVSDGLEKPISPKASDFDDPSRDQSSQSSIKWLSPPDPSMNYNVARDTQHKGTAVWFIERGTFKEWKKTGCLLWIQGQPGSGKSVLTSAIIHNIEPGRNRGTAHLAYFFFDFKDAGKQDARALLSSVLVQLSSQSTSFCHILLEFYTAHERGSQQPGDSALIECLEKMLKVPSQVPIYVIVDALDECPNTSGVQSPREKVLELVTELVGLRLPNLRLCITSRPEIGIRNVLEPLTLTSNRISLHDEEGQKKDIVDYISSVVYSDKGITGWGENDKELVVKTLSDRAGGKFRWVSCQFDTLRRCLTPDVSLARVLEELPETLDETYGLILQKIPEANRVHAHQLLQCLAVFARPLRMNELAEVLAVDLNAAGGIPQLNEDRRWKDQEQAVLTACSSLIAVVHSEDSRIVQFSHSTVKEFLTSDLLAATNVDTLRFHHICLEPAHTIMAQACVGVLLRLTGHIDNETMKRFPLADYAAKHFADHAEFGNVVSQIRNAIDELLDKDKPHFAAWMSRISSFWCAEEASPLYHVADLGFCGLVQHLVSKRPQEVFDVIIRGGIHGTPVHAALCRRHLQVCEVLLPHCIGLNIRDSTGQTLLHAAVGNGLVEVSQLILGKGVDINAKDDKGWTPLHQIINTYPQFDDRNLEIMRLLLKNGADIQAMDNNHSTPLHLAADQGKLAAAQLLIGHGAILHVKTRPGRTPLHCATCCGHPDVMRLLLEHGADIQATDDTRDTPLHLAADQGNLVSAQLLIKRGAILHAKNKTGRTPLHYAARCGHPHIIRLLLERGADIQATDDDHNTPLHLAAVQGKPDAAQLLIEHGAILHVKCTRGSTPLHYASFYGHSDIIRLLLERGADIQATNDKHDTPLHLAADQGKLAAAQLLIEHGAVLGVKGDFGKMPVHFASWNGHADTIRLLLERGADIRATDDNHDTPLHLAAKQGKLVAAQLLIEHGAVLDVKGNVGATPLHWASWHGHADTIRLLLERGADIQATNAQHDTPLHLAAYQGKLAAVQLLIEHGAVLDVKGNLGRTPLHCAARCEHPHIIRLLLERGADIQATDDMHDTPLHLAADHGKPVAAQLLIEHGAVLDVKSNVGETPLHYASCYGHSDTIRLLLERGADIQATTDKHDTPLHLAANEGKLVASQLLIEHGAVLDVKGDLGRTPVHLASWHGHADTIRLLLERGADIQATDDKHDTPLHLAVYQGKLAAAQLLIEHGAVLDVKSNIGETPLHYASFHGHSNTIRLLLERGADIQATNDKHDTPLHLAAVDNGKLAAAQLLIEHRAVLDVKSKIGMTPLHYASFNGCPDIIRLLLERGADIQATDDDGDTPLHLAVNQGKFDSAQLLIKHGALKRSAIRCIPHIAAFLSK